MRRNEVDAVIGHEVAHIANGDMVTLTLMFGWSLAIVAGSLALLGTTLVGLNDWAGFPISALVFIALPAILTQLATTVG